jgi:hypothetical protein
MALSRRSAGRGMSGCALLCVQARVGGVVDFISEAEVGPWYCIACRNLSRLVIISSDIAIRTHGLACHGLGLHLVNDDIWLVIRGTLRSGDRL